tara:strand:+ start:433 stop:612 length:180 start_codon:yes stop_codon:yes gene_type:complete
MRKVYYCNLCNIKYKQSKNIRGQLLSERVPDLYNGKLKEKPCPTCGKLFNNRDGFLIIT